MLTTSRRGSARGREGLRPTTNLVKGAIFQALSSFPWEGARVMDLYAGTGALGLESLRRGASFCTFVERAYRQCREIRARLETEGDTEKAHVVQMAVAKALKVLPGPYRLAFLDPPYREGIPASALEELGQGSLMEPGAWVVLEHSSREHPGADYGPLVLRKEYVYGDTGVSLFLKASEMD